MESGQRNRDALRTPSIWVGAIFLGVILSGGLISILMTSKGVSAAENRALAPVPVFSVWSLFSGSYTDSLELYYADNFPLRDELVQAATSIKGLSGYHNEIVYYQANAVEPQLPAGVVDSVKTIKKDTVLAVPAKKDTVKVKMEYDRSSSVVIYNNRAIQIFTASIDGAEKYIEMMNLYEASFDSLDVFCLVAPTQTDFYLPDEYKKSSNYEKKMIDFIYAGLDEDIHAVDAYGELSRHTGEYIYFNTDHHWTGRGAYYAYIAFCKSAGLKPYPLDSLDRKQAKRSFLGSLYGITLDKRLRKTADSVEYFKPRIPTRTFRWDNDAGQYEFSRLFANTHNYTNFIGGDHPMVRIESDVNDKKILVIKDSYGNAMMPFLALHYGTVYVMDYRYFDVNVRNFVSKYAIDAIMFLNNTFAANSKFTAYRGRYVLNLRTSSSPKPVVTDTTASSSLKGMK